MTLTQEQMLDQAFSLYDSYVRGITPNPEMTVSQWADERRILDSKSSKEAGPWNTARTPYLREIMEQISPVSPTIRIVAVKGAQLGLSECENNLIGFIMDVAPVPIILVTPTGKLAERFSKTRLAPMIDLATAPEGERPLREKVGDGASDTLLMKEYPGGVLVIASANSAAELRSMSACIMIFEEPDAYPTDVEDEGSVIDLVCARGATYSYRRKEVLFCTPTLEATSIVNPEYLAGDRRHYEMPCPHENCGKPTVWHRDYFRHQRGKPETAHFVCRHCGGQIFEGKHKTEMLASGVWRPTNPEPRALTRSYYIPSSLSPIGWKSWAQIAEEEDAAQGNYSKLKTLMNTVWGLVWRDSTSSPDTDALARRAKLEPYRQREIPEWVHFITAGVDVGIDHIEIGIWGFGENQRRHHVEQIRIRGRHNDPDTWTRLSSALRRLYAHPSGAYLPIRRVLIDRGFAPDYVDPWVATQDPDFVSSSKGMDSTDYIAKDAKKWARDADGKKIFGDVAVRFFLLGVDLLKMELYNRLNLTWEDASIEPPAGWISFSNDVARDWYDQLTAEECVVKHNKANGRAKAVWKKRNISARNEAMDCANYARAAAHLEGWDDWMPLDFERERSKLAKAAAELLVALDRLRRDRESSNDTRPPRLSDIVRNVVGPDDKVSVSLYGSTWTSDADMIGDIEATAHEIIDDDGVVQVEEKTSSTSSDDQDAFTDRGRRYERREAITGVASKVVKWKPLEPDCGSVDDWR